jgi:hypothetical protein
MAGQPNFAANPLVAMGQVSVANANRDGTGTIATIYTAPAGGARIDEIIIQAVAATSTGTVRLFVHDGTNARLWNETTVNAIASPGAGVSAFRAAVRNDVRPDLPLLLLPATWSIRAATHNTETFNIIVEGGTFL